MMKRWVTSEHKVKDTGDTWSGSNKQPLTDEGKPVQLGLEFVLMCSDERDRNTRTSSGIAAVDRSEASLALRSLTMAQGSKFILHGFNKKKF